MFLDIVLLVQYASKTSLSIHLGQHIYILMRFLWSHGITSRLTFSLVFPKSIRLMQFWLLLTNSLRCLDFYRVQKQLRLNKPPSCCLITCSPSLVFLRKLFRIETLGSPVNTGRISSRKPPNLTAALLFILKRMDRVNGEFEPCLISFDLLVKRFPKTGLNSYPQWSLPTIQVIILLSRCLRLRRALVGHLKHHLM